MVGKNFETIAEMGDKPGTSFPKIPVTPISGEVFFSIVLTPSALEPLYNLGIPARHSAVLPKVQKPATLIYNEKRWSLVFKGNYATKKFDFLGWRKFANDTGLKVGDACIFELVNEKKLEFKVQILDGQHPPEFLDEQSVEENANYEIKQAKKGEASASFVLID